MVRSTRPLRRSHKTYCPKCEQHAVVVITLPNHRTMCLPCLRKHEPDVYRNIAYYVRDRPPD